MKLKTSDILQLLPFEDQLKKDLQTAYSEAAGDRKFEIERMVWGVYDQLLDDALQAHLDEQMEDVLRGRRELSPRLYEEALDLVREQMTVKAEKGINSAELQNIREKLQTLIQ